MATITNLLDWRKTKLDRELESLALKSAATVAERGELAMKSLAYRRALLLFCEAANKVPQGHDAMRDRYLARAQIAAAFLKHWKGKDNE